MSDEPLQLLHNCIMCRRRPLRLYVDTYLYIYIHTHTRAHTHTLSIQKETQNRCVWACMAG